MEKNFDCIIIGAGPAGATAAVYLRRANLSVALIYKDGGSLGKAAEIENFYGTEKVSGRELFHRGLTIAESFGAEIINSEVTDISYDGDFSVSADGEYRAKALILATGSSHITPKIKGIEKFEGSGISRCAVCDGFFFRKKDVCVIGSGEYAKAEAEHLKQICKSVTILTDGYAQTADFSEYPVIDEKISEIIGDIKVTSVAFADGKIISVSGVFLAIGVASASDFARKLGAETSGSGIVTDSEMKTAVPGLFASGDCTGGLRQISTAAAQGTAAALSAIAFIRKK